MRVVSDKQGCQYQLQVTCDDTELLIAKLLHQDDVVGKVQCLFHPPAEMLISDLLIDNEVVHTPRTWLAWLMRIVFKPKPINYRQRGLGTHLLKFVVERARQREVRRIYGVLTQEDIDNTPGLINWYRKYGFQVGSPSPKDISKAVSRILMDLS